MRFFKWQFVLAGVLELALWPSYPCQPASRRVERMVVSDGRRAHRCSSWRGGRARRVAAIYPRGACR